MLVESFWEGKWLTVTVIRFAGVGGPTSIMSNFSDFKVKVVALMVSKFVGVSAVTSTEKYLSSRLPYCLGKVTSADLAQLTPALSVGFLTSSCLRRI